jgi:uncharacterized protein (DUF1697 family)
MIYTAMLRGINVGPHKRMKMEKLRSSCESLGFTKVQTYIQSGNIVFEAARQSSSSVSKKLEECIVSNFGFSADVILRTVEEMIAIVSGNPLLKEPGVDTTKFHVLFFSEAPSADAIKKLQSLTLSPDKVRHKGKEIYFYFPNGVSGSSIWKHNLDRVMSVSGTMRNWKTVNTLCEMAVACK